MTVSYLILSALLGHDICRIKQRSLGECASYELNASCNYGRQSADRSGCGINVFFKRNILVCLDLILGATHQLSHAVDAPVAMDKTVIYTSDHPEIVKVDQTGKLTALAEGTATITVTTNLGGLTDTCVVKVEKGALPIDFVFTGKTEFNLVNGVYEVSISTFDLLEYLTVANGIEKSDVKFKIKSGSAATISGSTVTFTKDERLVTILAYAGSEEAPTAQKELKLVLKY